jgi:hypothetical protein
MIEISHEGSRYMRRSLSAVLTALGLIATALPGGAAPTTSRVSVSNTEKPGNDGSFDPQMSPNGRYVVFESKASNLVSNDVEDTQNDIFLRDRELGKTTLVNRNSAGVKANGYSDDGYVSANGKVVVFESQASNLAPKDLPGRGQDATDVFVRNLGTGKTKLVSAAMSGQEPDEDSADVSISGDGKLAVFESDATNLVPNDTNGESDIFLRDLAAGTTTRISVSSDEAQGNDESESPIISTDGTAVAFESDSTNFDDHEVEGDGDDDIFVRDLVTGQTTRAALSSSEQASDNGSSDPSISATGDYVAFNSFATNFSDSDPDFVGDVFVRDMIAGTTDLVSLSSAEAPGTLGSFDTAVSQSGRYVVFVSEDPFVANDTNDVEDVYLRDRTKGTTKRVSVAANGDEAKKASDDPVISAGGSFVVFDSLAPNLTPPDRNGAWDVFIRGPLN